MYMNQYDLQKDNVFVSEKTATYVIYSGHLFIVASIITYYLKHYLLCFASICLYLSTMMFWSNVHINNLYEIKLLDMSIATITILLVLFYYTPNYIKPRYKYIVYSVFSTAILVYIINEFMYYFTVKTHNNYSKIVNINRREFMNELTVLSHIIFIHVLPVFTYSYCAVLSM